MKQITVVNLVILAVLVIQNLCFSTPYLDLPPSSVNMKIHQHPGGSNNYYDLEFWDVPLGYDVYDGVWTGWCADSTLYIYLGKTYSVGLYDSYDASLPSYTQDDEKWDYTNYILNNKLPGATWREIQAAIWYFTDSNPDYYGYWTSNSDIMVQDALAHGENFVPDVGEMMAVIFDTGPTIQGGFIEVERTAPKQSGGIIPEISTLIMFCAGLSGIIGFLIVLRRKKGFKMKGVKQ
ncbi:MAG: hypothetical protein ACE5PV_09565 [Candidatus Poribacteria bacterium]